MKLRKSEGVFLQLLRGSIIGTSSYRTFEPLSKKEWTEVYQLAKMHGMISVLMGELDKLPKRCLPPMDMLMFWLGQAAHRETTYRQQLDLSCEFADALAEEGIKCLVLKGLSVGSYYPAEKSREFGDLDCFLVKDSKLAFSEGNSVGRRLGAKVEQSGYKHTHIHYKDLLIENHKYLTNFNETRQGVVIEKTMRSLALKGVHKRIKETNLWVPDAEFNVLFLLKHSLGDFLANDMTIKAVYDWAVFLKAEHEHIDWQRIRRLSEECRLTAFFEVMTQAAMTYLGLELHNGEMPIASHGRMADWLMRDVLDKSVVPRKKTLLMKAKRLLDRAERMVKYRRITTERIYTALWTTIRYRPNFHRDLNLE